jgi:periplasmic protein TonB
VSDLQLPLTISLAGHALCLALLWLFLPDSLPPEPEPIAKGGIEVVFEPVPPKAEAVSAAAPAAQQEVSPPAVETPASPPEPQTELTPLTSEPPVVATEPAPPPPEAPAVAAEPPPPPAPHKSAAARASKPTPRRQVSPQPSQAYLPSPPQQVPPASPAPAPSPTASAATAVPAPLPSPEANAAYGALLSAWLESHKRYPEAARRHGDEGSAVLRFEVDRSGRVIDYAVTKSSGSADLDQSIEELIRDATFPPPPANIDQSHMKYWVNIRFSLKR